MNWNRIIFILVGVLHPSVCTWFCKARWERLRLCEQAESCYAGFCRSPFDRSLHGFGYLNWRVEVPFFIGHDGFKFDFLCTDPREVDFLLANAWLQHVGSTGGLPRMDMFDPSNVLGFYNTFCVLGLWIYRLETDQFQDDGLTVTHIRMWGVLFFTFHQHPIEATLSLCTTLMAYTNLAFGFCVLPLLWGSSPEEHHLCNIIFVCMQQRTSIPETPTPPETLGHTEHAKPAETSTWAKHPHERN